MFFWNRSDASEFDSYGWDETNPPPTSWYVQRVFLFALIVVGAIGVSSIFYGQAMAEKSITGLLQPVGLAWIGLSLVIYFSMFQRRYIVAGSCFCCWLVITIAGNQFVSNSLAASLESRYYHMNPYEGEPKEYAILLGGGSVTGPNGLSQMSMNGDRLAVAGRMYHAGQVKKIICSGTNSFNNDVSKGPGETAFEVLQGLGVPASDLIPMQGKNTFEEIMNLKHWIAQQVDAGNDPGRVGLISSAWHLPRVQRLANKHELNVSPMPANFLSGPTVASPHMVVPGAYQILVTSQIMKEHMAKLVKR